MLLTLRGDIELDVEDRGSGEPIVFIQTALTADELVPLASQSRLRDRYRTIVYHRRGYGNSSSTNGPGSIERDADDCRHLLDALAVDRAHVVGVSYSAAIGLKLAEIAPRSVHTLTIGEPPPVHTSHADEFIDVCEELMDLHRTRGARFALDAFLTRLMGPAWRDDLERRVPGAVQQAIRDAGTFFETDIPALLSWQFDAETARKIHQPVLHLGGTESGPWFSEVRETMLDWLAQAEDAVIEGAGHDLVATHPERAARIVADFIGRHPVSGRLPPDARSEVSDQLDSG